MREIIFGEKTNRKTSFSGGEIIIVLFIIKNSIISDKILMENIAGNEALIKEWRPALIYQGTYLINFLLN